MLERDINDFNMNKNNSIDAHAFVRWFSPLALDRRLLLFAFRLFVDENFF
jgi:hypothetical protein